MIKTDTRWAVGAGAILVASALLTSRPVLAETLESALAQAYRNNPTLNAQRASQRATDELVPQALANYRPRVNASIDSGYQHYESNVLSAGQQLLTNTNISPRGGNVGARRFGRVAVDERALATALALPDRGRVSDDAAQPPRRPEL